MKGILLLALLLTIGGMVQSASTMLDHSSSIDIISRHRLCWITVVALVFFPDWRCSGSIGIRSQGWHWVVVAASMFSPVKDACSRNGRGNGNNNGGHTRWIMFSPIGDAVAASASNCKGDIGSQWQCRHWLSPWSEMLAAAMVGGGNRGGGGHSGSSGSREMKVRWS